uniref:Uncharacterized protein n=1 Tax=Caenorhabditis japonica TaxID=281687 RepID=A0A8R1HXR5_CAEJA
MKLIVAVILIGIIKRKVCGDDVELDMRATDIRKSLKETLPFMEEMKSSSELRAEVKKLSEKCSPLVYNSRYRFYLPDAKVSDNLRQLQVLVSELLKKHKYADALKAVDAYRDPMPTDLEYAVPRQTHYGCGPYPCNVTLNGDKMSLKTLCLIGPKVSKIAAHWVPCHVVAKQLFMRKTLPQNNK